MKLDVAKLLDRTRFVGLQRRDVALRAIDRLKDLSAALNAREVVRVRRYALHRHREHAAIVRESSNFVRIDFRVATRSRLNRVRLRRRVILSAMRWICKPHVAMERHHHLRIERRLRCLPTESSDTRAPIGAANLVHSTGDSIAVAIVGIGEFTNHSIGHMFKQPEADDLRPDAQRHANFTEWTVRGVLHAEIPAFEFSTRTIGKRDKRTLRL